MLRQLVSEKFTEAGFPLHVRNEARHAVEGENRRLCSGRGEGELEDGCKYQGDTEGASSANLRQANEPSGHQSTRDRAGYDDEVVSIRDGNAARTRLRTM